MSGKYVETEEYCKALEKYGFKYAPMTKSLVLSYPYVPKPYEKEAVKIQLTSPTVSSLSKIDLVQYYRSGSGYKLVTDPEKGFKEYVEDIMTKCYAGAHPKYVLA